MKITSLLLLLGLLLSITLLSPRYVHAGESFWSLSSVLSSSCEGNSEHRPIKSPPPIPQALTQVERFQHSLTSILSRFPSQDDLKDQERTIDMRASSGEWYHLEEGSWMEIDLRNFRMNIKNIRKFLKSKTKLCLVLKSNAYGHGIKRMAKIANEEGIDCLAVNNNGEAKLLRVNGNIKVPIYRLRPASLQEIATAIPLNITEEVRNLEEAERISKMVQELRASSTNYHEVTVNLNLFLPPIHFDLYCKHLLEGQQLEDELKIVNCKKVEKWKRRQVIEDYTKEYVDLYQKISSLPGLKITGLFSHFFSEEMDSMKAQNEYFESVKSAIKSNAHLKDDPCREGEENSLICHLASSPAIVRYPDSQHDLVRVGMMVYGAPDRDGKIPEGISPIMSVRAPIIDVYQTAAEEDIGYQGEVSDYKSMKVALIPTGYSQGISPSGQKYVLIHDEYLPVMSIHQDKMLVDITKAKSKIMAGDIVTLLGRDDQNEISVKDITPDGESPDQVLISLGNYFHSQKHLNPNIIKYRD